MTDHGILSLRLMRPRTDGTQRSEGTRGFFHNEIEDDGGRLSRPTKRPLVLGVQ